MKTLRAAAIAVLLAASAAAARAEFGEEPYPPGSLLSDHDELGITTYFDAPFGDYLRLQIGESLAAGLDDADDGPLLGGEYTAALYGSVAIEGNGVEPRFESPREDVPPYDGPSYGGHLAVDGDFEVEDADGLSLLFIYSSTSRMGVGTDTPQATLDVEGDVKAMMIFAFSDPSVSPPPANTGPNGRGEPQVSMFTTPGGVIEYCKFDATYWDTLNGYKRHCTLHLDGSPLILQSTAKGVAEGLGFGQVSVKGRKDAIGYDSGDNAVAFVVGEPKASSPPAAWAGPPANSPSPGGLRTDPAGQGSPYPDTNPGGSPWMDIETRAANWYYSSSREWKKDIVPLRPADYRAVLGEIGRMKPVRYAYNDESGKRPHLGFVAEEAPAEIVDASRKTVSLDKEAGFLLAAAKTLLRDSEDLKRRVEALKNER